MGWGGSFADFDKVLDEAVEREYNTIRIDPMPQWIDYNNPDRAIDGLTRINHTCHGFGISEVIRQRTPDKSEQPRCAESLLMLGLEGSRDEKPTLWVFNSAIHRMRPKRRKKWGDFR